MFRTSNGLDVIEEAHNYWELKAMSQCLYGHIEKPEHIIDHLIKIRELTKERHMDLYHIDSIEV